jgi:hypothetical protein
LTLPPLLRRVRLVASGLSSSWWTGLRKTALVLLPRRRLRLLRLLLLLLLLLVVVGTRLLAASGRRRRRGTLRRRCLRRVRWSRVGRRLRRLRRCCRWVLALARARGSTLARVGSLLAALVSATISAATATVRGLQRHGLERDWLHRLRLVVRNTGATLREPHPLRMHRRA